MIDKQVNELRQCNPWSPIKSILKNKKLQQSMEDMIMYNKVSLLTRLSNPKLDLKVRTHCVMNYPETPSSNSLSGIKTQKR